MDRKSKIAYQFIPVPTEIYDAMLPYNFTRAQMTVLVYVIRKTFGFKGRVWS